MLGYYRAQARLADGEFAARVASLPAGVGGRPGEVQESVLGFEGGHVLVRHDARLALQPAAVRDGAGNVLALVGFVLGDPGTTPARGSAELLAELVRDGSSAAERWEGEFAAAWFDSSARALHLIGDRFAARPLFLRESHGELLFSTHLFSLAAALASPPAPDPLGWLQIVGHAHCVGARTHLAGVERLLPGAHVTASAAGVTRRLYWRIGWRPDDALVPEEHAEATLASLRASVRRRAALVPGALLSLSGGLDSRLIAGLLPPGSGVRALTFDDGTPKGAAEARAAHAVARACRLSHEIVPLDAEPPSAVADRIVAATGGMLGLNHPWKTTPTLAQMRAHARFQLGGGPGDSLAGAFTGALCELSPRRVASGIAAARARRLTFGREPRSVLRLLFRRDVVEAHADELAGELRASFERSDGPTAAHKITAWALGERQPAFTFQSPIHGDLGLSEASPHLGYAYVERMLCLPAPWLFGRAFYAWMTWYGLPELRDVPYANTGQLLSPRLALPRGLGARRADLERGAVAFGKRHAPLALLRAAAGRREHGVYAAFRADAALLARLEELVAAPALAALVDPRAARRLLARFRAGRPLSIDRESDVALVGSLATMALTFEALRRG